MKTAIVVVDSPVDHDRRVTAMIVDLRAANFKIEIVDARCPAVSPGATAIIRASLWCLVSGIEVMAANVLRLGAYFKFWKEARVSRYNYPLLVNYFQEARMMIVAVYRGHLHRLLSTRRPDLVVANDLLAGAFARAMLRNLAKTRLYYDAHEFSPFRNRDNNSVARVAANLVVECWVARGSFRMACVSQAIRDASAALYALTRVDYVPNAYYAESHEPEGGIDPALPLHIVYFGAPAAGRGLQLLGKIAEQDKSLKVTLFVPEFLDFHESLEGLKALPNVRVRPGMDYESEMLNMLKQQSTVLSWCVIEDLCLSYRMAEPSKFHQSLMFGLPVIVAENQHLATFVKIDGNGMVIPQADLESAVASLACIRRELDQKHQTIGRAAIRVWENSSCFPGWEWPDIQ